MIKPAGVKFFQMFKHKEKPSTNINPVVHQAVDEAVLSGASSEVSTIKQVKNDLVEPLQEFAKDHPVLSTFIAGMAAGGLAGLLEKKAEEKKEIAHYLKNTEKFVNRMVRREFLRNSMALTLGCLAVGATGGFIFAPLIFSALGFSGGDFGTRLAGGMLGSAVALPSILLNFNDKLTIKPEFSSKDGKFLCTNSRTGNFVTIPPSGNKLVFCKMSDNGKVVPEKEIELNAKAASLTFDEHKGNFYVNYEDGKKMTGFSFDGKKLKDINLFMSV